MRVIHLDDSDLEAFLRPLQGAGSKFDSPARKEIANWTGGVPVLACALLGRLWDEKRGKSLSQDDVNEAAKVLLKKQYNLLAELWEECDVELRADLSVLAGGTTIPRSRISEDRLREIEDRGFGQVSGRNLVSSCRLIQRYVQGQKRAVTDLNRPFWNRFRF